jgi:hypothetical protein
MASINVNIGSRRRSRRGNVGGDLLLKAFTTLLSLLVLIGSFLLFGAWLYFERKKQLLLTPKSLQDFAHTNTELSEIQSQDRKLSMTYNRLDQIAKEGSSLTIRQDGKYNERSKKGKELNNEISKLEPHASSLEKSLADLVALPEKRLNDWAFYASMNLASRLSLLSYILSFMFFAWQEPDWVLTVSGYLQSLSLFDYYSAYPLAYGASIGSLVVSLLVLTVSFYHFRTAKKESLARVTVTESGVMQEESGDEMTSEEFTNNISHFPHSDLKKMADLLNLKVDRRSKKNILEAIKEQPPQLLLAALDKYQNSY